MDWQVGYKLVHPFNTDWGVGEVLELGPQGRSLVVRFPGSEDPVTLSTHAAAYQRWTFPVGARAKVLSGPGKGQEVVIQGRVRQPSGFDTYQTSEGESLDERSLSPLQWVAGPLSKLEHLEVDPLDQFENRYAGMLLEMERQNNGLAGILGARVTLFPHQLYVASKVIRNQPVRALLADEVGLGKTIEAGMIYSALRQAGRGSRVLILTPDALAIQWLGEMFRKFHDVFVLIDEERIEDAAADHPELSPFQVYPRAVCSLPFLVSNQLLAMEAAEADGGWDLLIVDEAHHLRYEEGGGNAAYQVVEPIAENARNVLFLTATPMELDRSEYFGLLRLLKPKLFHDFELFEIQLEEISHANELVVQLERALGENPDLDAPSGAARSSVRRAPIQLPADLPDKVADHFPEHMQLESLAERAVMGDRSAVRQMLSELTHIHPLGDTVYSNTRARVGGFPPRRGLIKAFPLSPARQQIYADVHAWVREVKPQQLDPRSPEARRLFDLVRLAAGPLPGLRHELNRLKKAAKSKTTLALFDSLLDRIEKSIHEDNPRLDALVGEVREMVGKKEKLLVFVSHIQDLEYLKDRIEARAGVRVAVFHEGLPPADRDIQVAMFRSPDGYPVLLSSEAGGEGRNFQFCHRIVHYDLPASPNRVEQRIGRLDRIGQTQEVESVVLVAEDTIEARLAELLDTQIGVFSKTIGGLDPVLESIGELVMQLSLSRSADNPEAWQALREEAHDMMTGARDAITRGLDHLLHRGAYDEQSARELHDTVAEDIEERLEEFVLEFCELTGITVTDRDQHGTWYLALDRYTTLDGLPGVPIGTGYVGTFARERALEREDHDFYATGHPLVEGIFSFLRDTPFGTVTLRRFRKTGLKKGACLQFNYRLEPDAHGDVDATVFFPPQLITLAFDLKGTPRPELLPWLTARHSKAHPLDLEDVEHITMHPGWMATAAGAAEDAVQKVWDNVLASALERFDTFKEEEEKKLEAYFEHRLDTAEARMAFSSGERAARIAQIEVRTIQQEWKRQKEALVTRRELLGRGGPVLDSLALVVVDS